MRVGSKGRRKAPSTGLGEGGREFERWHRRERKRAGEERAGGSEGGEGGTSEEEKVGGVGEVTGGGLCEGNGG